jgi:hypothetical protein
MRAIIILAALALSACATRPPSEPEIRTVEIGKPVAVQPIKPSDIPTAPPPLGPRPPTLQQTADAAFAGHCRDVSWIIKVFPLLQVSAGLPPAQAPDYPECRKH